MNDVANPARRCSVRQHHSTATLRVLGVLHSLSWGLFFVVLGNFVFSFACDNFGHFVPHFMDGICLPLNEPDGIAVDPKGRLYISLWSYSRVQVYDQHGRFVFGFFTDAMGSRVQLCFDEQGRLQVVHRSSVTLYDRSGHRIGRVFNVPRDRWIQLDQQKQRGIVDPTGNVYRLERRGFNWQVVRYDPHGNVTLQLTNPVWVVPLTYPLSVLEFIPVVGLMYGWYLFSRSRLLKVCRQCLPDGRVRRRDVVLRHALITQWPIILVTRQHVCWATRCLGPYICVPIELVEVEVDRPGLFFSRLIFRSSTGDEITVRMKRAEAMLWLQTIAQLRDSSREKDKRAP